MYEAQVVRVTTEKHPGADRLNIARFNGYQLITTMSLNNELVVFFPEGGQLAEQFCFENSLYRAGKGNNKDPQVSGYFDADRRVRSLKLRGIVSEGCLFPLDAFAYVGDINLKEGETFTSLNGKEICRKYVTPATQMRIAGNTSQQKLKPEDRLHLAVDFPKHFDTKQLRDNFSRIPIGALLVITEKKHGTSGRTTRTLRHLPLKKWQELWNRFCKFIRCFTWIVVPKTEEVTVSGTRNTIINPFNPYAKEDNYRLLAEAQFKGKLALGETVYYEIVGYDSSKPLFAHSTGEKDTDEFRKELKKKYGEHIHYSYGCQPGQSKVYVYRITQVENGKVHELTWNEVILRCLQLGVSPVTQLTTTHYSGPQDLLDTIKSAIATAEKAHPTHPVEGVCVRLDHPNVRVENSILKYKGPEFCHLEGIAKNNDLYIDPEEVA